MTGAGLVPEGTTNIKRPGTSPAFFLPAKRQIWRGSGDMPLEHAYPLSAILSGFFISLLAILSAGCFQEHHHEDRDDQQWVQLSLLPLHGNPRH